MNDKNAGGTSEVSSAIPVPDRRLRWDHENLSRKVGARQSKAYREAVAADIERMEER